MNNKKIILNLYRSKIRLCQTHGYKLGSYKNINPGFNLGRALMKCKKIKNKQRRSNFIMSYVRQGYKDNIDINDDFIVNMYIDEGFQVLRNLNNLLKHGNKKKYIEIEKFIDDDLIFFDYFND